MPTHIRLPHNVPDTRSNEASPKQIALLERLIEEREMTDEQASWYIDRIYRHRNQTNPYLISKTEISKWFGKRELGTGLFGRPLRTGMVPDHKKAFVAEPFGTPVQDVGEQHLAVPANFTEVARTRPRPPVQPVRNRVAAEVGVYRHNGKVYVVRKRRGREYRYATVLVELGLPRLNEHGQTVTHDFVQAHGMQYELSAEERITDDEEIKALCIQVGRCIMCSHAIWQAKSVARMMGTRCYKRAHGLI
jgi:hypothetical protein